MTVVSDAGLAARSRAVLLGGLAIALVAAVWPGAARAQDYPSIEPLRDVSVTYDLQSTATGAMTIKVLASPEAQVLRLQLASGSDYLLLDRATERVMLVSPDKGLVFAVPSNGMLHRRLGPDSGLRFARAGHRTVAGLGCTLWMVRGPGGHGDACVTQDGVVLEGEGQGDKPDDHGEIPSGRVVATSVTYGALPEALFEAPPGLQEVDLPPSLFRAMIPGLAGIQTP
jgi:hypothetical protein